MHLRLLDKYVLKELLYPFVFGVASFSSIFIASSLLFKIVQYITTYGAPIPTVARLFLYSLPEIVNYTFPMAVLLATLMAFGKLSGNSEIVAMKSGGVSYYRIVAPVIIVGFVVSIFSVIWAEKVVPPSKHEAKQILAVEIRGNVKPKTQDHVVIKTLSGSTQRITYARSFNESTGVMSNVTIEEFQNEKLARVQTAKKAIWKEDSWVLEDGNVFTVDEKEGVTSKAAFSKQVIPL
ncbi:MAG: LptF/LptG family permease, partial [Succiniclasticum sp.]|nr:LptF/LptG family permease [Succiniclasticum sp.]